ncbi:MAG: hypothetical protein VB071_08395 [Lawsonibacter sp.]|nr:hypothetical protein [Lawsonibacter sp.]
MEHYKSWAGLNKQLHETLCDSLKDKIRYFLTRYHEVHNAYGRAAILLDGKELVCFSWIEMYRQDSDLAETYDRGTGPSYEDATVLLKPKWDADCTYCEMDFLNAALQFRSLAIRDALESENYIIKMLAIMDKRVGQRTLSKIAADEVYLQYPEWVRQFYELRLAQKCYKS